MKIQRYLIMLFTIALLVAFMAPAFSAKPIKAEVTGIVYCDWDWNDQYSSGDPVYTPSVYYPQYVTVTLKGHGSTYVKVVDATGKFDFTGLKPGKYTISASLPKPSPMPDPEEYYYLAHTGEYTINVRSGQAVNVTETMGLFSIHHTSQA